MKEEGKSTIGVDDDRMFELTLLLELAHEEVRRFQSALYLADLSFRRRREFSDQASPGRPPRDFQTALDWATIAAHSAIHSLYQYRKILELLTSWNGPTDAKNIDALHTSAHNALILFDKKFPKAEQLRHTIAHISEITGEFSKNSHKDRLTTRLIQKSSETSMVVINAICDNAFVTTRRGELLEFELTHQHVQELVKIHKDLMIGIDHK